jgi:hypothetical protein
MNMQLKQGPVNAGNGAIGSDAIIPFYKDLNKNLERMAVDELGETPTNDSYV